MTFIDTGAFLARYLPNDQHHKAATVLWNKIRVTHEPVMAGRTVSNWGAPRNRALGEDNRFEALRAAIAMEKAFLELAGGHATAWLAFAPLVYPDLGKTDHHPAKQAQCKSGLGVADATVVLAQDHVERMMQAALDDPVATFEFEKACGVQFFEGEAANEVNDLGGLLAFAPDPSAQPRNGLPPGKAHLLRGDFLTVQHPDFVSSPIVLPAQGMRARGGPRGKKAVQ